MKTFFESYCATENISINELKTMIDNYIKNNDFTGLLTKLQNNIHELGDYYTVDVYVNMIEPDWDDTDSDEAFEYDMLIEQAKKLSDYVTSKLYDTN